MVDCSDEFAVLDALPTVQTGEWLGGQKHGEGSYHFRSDGSILSGLWVAGFLKRGRWILPTGAVYVGEFELNKPNGQGSWILPNGTQVLVEYIQQVGEEAFVDCLSR